jgi:hypothetical protein
MEEEMKLDINPQEIMMLAEEGIRHRWTQGKYHGPGDTVCLVGSLQSAVSTVLDRQFKSALEEVPEFTLLPPTYQRHVIHSMKHQLQNALVKLFTERMAKTLPDGFGSIEGFNDMYGRRHEEVMAIMQVTLEEITKECLQAWETEIPSQEEAQELGIYVPVRKA